MSELFETTLEIEDIPFIIEYYFNAGEPQTYWYQGSPADVELKRILFAGEELSPKQEELFVDKYGETALNDFLLEDSHEQYQSAADQGADFYYEQWKDERKGVA